MLGTFDWKCMIVPLKEIEKKGVAGDIVNDVEARSSKSFHLRSTFFLVSRGGQIVLLRPVLKYFKGGNLYFRILWRKRIAYLTKRKIEKVKKSCFSYLQ